MASANSAARLKQCLIYLNVKRHENTWTNSAPMLEYIEYMTSRAYLVITTFGLITNRILAQFLAASFIIAEIMRCLLHGDAYFTVISFRGGRHGLS